MNTTIPLSLADDPLIPLRVCPSKDVLEVLNQRLWVCSFSGGKDSTSLVTWIEWLRRIGLVRCANPSLVMSDTTVEYPFLRGLANELMARLSSCGWHCEVVVPRIQERLYNRIFGVGNVPVHPGNRRAMRWCTRATKIDPMKRWSKTLGDNVVQLSGVRWGESLTRDGKLSAGGCAAGGECGLPNAGEGVYGPIITWKTCKVIEWLSGEAGVQVNQTLPDLLPLMRQLVDVYEVKQEAKGLFDIPPKVSALRFGCIGCPAISNEKVTRSRQAQSHPEWEHLARLYGIWKQLYLRDNRCCRIKKESSKSIRKGPKPTWYSDQVGFGPLRMQARQRYFAELLDIQQKAQVTLVTAEDESFIRDCWERKVYPRGWSEADEATVPPDETLYAGQE